MAEKIYNVLFLCTQNSARSIMAECVLNRVGGGKFRAYSAGSHPAARVNPEALKLLARLNYPTAGLRSKSWDEFAVPGAPQMDFVFTVCDKAAGEVCPIWPGQPMTAHWPFTDPAAFEGTEAQRSALFADVYGQIERRIAIFASLPLASLDQLSLKKRLDEMGKRLPETA
jgi:arsenate reductase (thioredoxin)